MTPRVGDDLDDAATAAESLYQRAQKAKKNIERASTIGAYLGSVVPGIGTAAGSMVGSIAGAIVEAADLISDIFDSEESKYVEYIDQYGPRRQLRGWREDFHFVHELVENGEPLFRSRRAEEDGVARSAAFAYLALHYKKLDPALGRQLGQEAIAQKKKEERALKLDGFHALEERAAHPSNKFLAGVQGKSPDAYNAFAWMRRKGVSWPDAARAVKAQFGWFPYAARLEQWDRRAAGARQRYLAGVGGPTAPKPVEELNANPGDGTVHATVEHLRANPGDGTVHATVEHLRANPGDGTVHRVNDTPAATPSPPPPPAARRSKIKPDRPPSSSAAPRGAPAFLRPPPLNVPRPPEVRPMLPIPQFSSPIMYPDGSRAWSAQWHGHQLSLSRTPLGIWCGKLVILTAGGPITLTASASEATIRALFARSGMAVGDVDIVGATRRAVLTRLRTDAGGGFEGVHGLAIKAKRLPPGHGATLANRAPVYGTHPAKRLPPGHGARLANR